MPEGKKVGLKPGFSLMHWAKRCETEPNISGRNGEPLRPITMDELEQHGTPEDGWTAIFGRVYNVVPYKEYHPGGDDILMRVVGKDGTEAVQNHHPWVNIHGLVGALEIGWLVDENGEPLASHRTPSDAARSSLVSPRDV